MLLASSVGGLRYLLDRPLGSLGDPVKASLLHQPAFRTLQISRKRRWERLVEKVGSESESMCCM